MKQVLHFFLSLSVLILWSFGAKVQAAKTGTGYVPVAKHSLAYESGLTTKKFSPLPVTRFERSALIDDLENEKVYVEEVEDENDESSFSRKYSPVDNYFSLFYARSPGIIGEDEKLRLSFSGHHLSDFPTYIAFRVLRI